MKATLAIPAVLVALVAVGGHLVSRGESGRSSPQEHKLPKSSLGNAAANGIVEGTRPEAALRPEIAGTIAVIHVRENQDVSKGTLLVELRNETQQQQVALAEADVAIAKAQLDRLCNGERAEKRDSFAALEKAKKAVYEQAKAEWERSRRLTPSSTVSQEQHDENHFKMLRTLAEWQQAQAERALIEAPARADEVAAAQGRLAAAEAQLRLAEAELAKTRLVAPSSGRILQVYAEPGELAGPATVQPVLRLADVSKRRVRAFVEELDAARVEVNQRAIVTADGFPGKEFVGRVTQLVPRMGQRTPQSDAPGESKDVYFREVLIDLEGGDELPLNLRVLTHIYGNP
jgi:multidrug resistance efflux pump